MIILTEYTYYNYIIIKQYAVIINKHHKQTENIRNLGEK